MRRGKRYLKDLDTDIHDHIERETLENIERGMSPEKARQEALRKFGNVAVVKEDTLAVWSSVWLGQLRQDFRYAVRMLVRNAGFSSVIIVTLALGIGMNTAVFSLFNAVLLRPLPYSDPERLLWVTTYEKEWNEEFVDDAVFREWREQGLSFEQLVAYETRDETIRTSNSVIRSQIGRVSDDFWKLTAAVPALGRLPRQGEPELMLLHRFFERWFQSDPGIVGKTIRVGRIPVIVAGVLPKGVEFYFPKSSLTPLDLGDIAGYASVGDDHFSALNGVIAKLRPNVSLDAAQAELQVIRARISDGRGRGWVDRMELRAMPLQEKIVGEARRPLAILLVAVGFVLLITSANVGNLMLARASARQKEIAVRVSLGAGRGRVFRQFLVESTLLAALGGVAGLLLAHWSVATLVQLAPQAVPRLAEARIAGNVLAFAAAVSIVTAVLFGLAPGWSIWKPQLHALRDAARTASATSGSVRVRRLLVATELMLATVLLTGAGLMVKSFWLMYAYPAGFQPDRILTMKVNLSGPEYFQNAQRQNAYIENALKRVRSIPDVAAGSVLFRGQAQDVWEGAPPLPPDQEPPVIMGSIASADYAKVMGLQVVRGRWFTDSEQEQVIVINESLARRDFRGQNPIGHRLKSVGTVVGVVGDLKFSKLDAASEPEFFTPYAPARQARGDSSPTFVMKTWGDASAAVPTIQKVVSAVDGTVPIFDSKTLERALADSITPRRFNLLLLGSFAAVALVLALVGIYGVTAYSVAQRSQEIGIRMALGAQRKELVRMILRQGMVIALAGIGAGLAAALALTRLMTSLLYDVEPTDAQTFAIVTLALLATTVFACWLPALKAALVDPIIALRHE